MVGLSNFSPFSYKAAIELASPRSWVAAFGPVIIAGALAAALSVQPGSGIAIWDFRSLAILLGLGICAILMQSAVNALNDYQDFKSGLDSAQTVLDKTDASIVYNNINPRHALYFAVACLVAAAVLGLVLVLQTSYVLLLLGLLAALIVVLYSSGPKPISYLPLGEPVSGLAMGGLITVATFYALTSGINGLVLAAAVVPFVSIAQIMQTNNTCDIQRDIQAGRSTLPVKIGHLRSAILNAGLGWFCFVWMLALLVYLQWYLGIVVVVVGAIICFKLLVTLRTGPYDLLNRGKMMGTVIIYNRWLMAIWAAALLTGGLGHVYLS